MINRDELLEAIEAPMTRYCDKAKKAFCDWKPLLTSSEKLLAGEDVKKNEVPDIFVPIVKFMVAVMEEEEWDWSKPEIQNLYREVAESDIYKIFADGTMDVVSSVLDKYEIGTLVEVGAGLGHVTTGICDEMRRKEIEVPVIISDKIPQISETGAMLRGKYPEFDISDFQWDFRKEVPREMFQKLKKPVFLFERFCIPYTGLEGIDTIAPLADILLMVEDLNITGKKEAYDIIFEKIGANFLTLSEAEKFLSKHFSFIHTCDKEAIEAINSPVTDFTLAAR